MEIKKKLLDIVRDKIQSLESDNPWVRHNAIKLRDIFIFSTLNRMALPPLYGTEVTVSKK